MNHICQGELSCKKYLSHFRLNLLISLTTNEETLSRNQFVLRLLRGALREQQERALHSITAEVYGDSLFAQEEERLAEDFFEVAPEAEL